MKIKDVRSVSLCPFDDLPCSHVDSCDEVVALAFGSIPPCRCSRAVFKVGKK